MMIILSFIDRWGTQHILLWMVNVSEMILISPILPTQNCRISSSAENLKEIVQDGIRVTNRLVRRRFYIFWFYIASVRPSVFLRGNAERRSCNCKRLYTYVILNSSIITYFKKHTHTPNRCCPARSLGSLTSILSGWSTDTRKNGEIRNCSLRMCVVTGKQPLCIGIQKMHIRSMFI